MSLTRTLTFALIISFLSGMLTFLAYQFEVDTNFFKFDKQQLTCYTINLPLILGCYFSYNDTKILFYNVSYDIYEQCFNLNANNQTCSLYYRCDDYSNYNDNDYNDFTNQLYTKSQCNYYFIINKVIISVVFIGLFLIIIALTASCFLRRRKHNPRATYRPQNPFQTDNENLLRENNVYSNNLDNPLSNLNNSDTIDDIVPIYPYSIAYDAYGNINSNNYTYGVTTGDDEYSITPPKYELKSFEKENNSSTA